MLFTLASPSHLKGDKTFYYLNDHIFICYVLTLEPVNTIS